MLRAQESVRVLVSSGSGKAGVAFLTTLIVLSIYVLATYPLDFGLRTWSNPAAWADNPKAVPPAWLNLFSEFKRAEGLVFEATRPAEAIPGEGSITYVSHFPFEFTADEPPTFLSMSMSGVAYSSRPPVVSLKLIRPDGNQVLVYSFVVPGPAPGETPPIMRYIETPFRVKLSSDSTAVAATAEFARRTFGIPLSERELTVRGIEQVLFGSPTAQDGSTFQILKGGYRFQVEAVLYSEADSIPTVRLVLGGSTFGLLGTDSLGRDLAVGLLFGFPVALFIGLATSTLSTLIGSSLGIVSGYVGGRTDTFIQRVSDVLNNIPLLPILIFLSFIIGATGRLWAVILILIAFSWPGLTVVIRSMVLQLKSSQFVEAALTLGARKGHIMLRHIFPQTAPFVLAQLIFFAPAAILAEAALSFLGLGDPSLPTWGQILEQGFRSGGVYVGFWWWVLPPGLLVVFTAMTFVLIALGLEPLVSPRLRKR